MGIRYYVHVLEGPQVIETRGPYGLVSAKDYARIGSQFGRPRAITRGHQGPTVRVYSEGRRYWPLVQHVPEGALQGFEKEEIPIEMVAGRRDIRLGAAVRAIFARTPNGTVVVDIEGENPAHKFRQLMLTQHGIQLSYSAPIAELWDMDGSGSIAMAMRFDFTEKQGMQLMAGEVVHKNVLVSQLEEMVLEGVTRH